VRRLLAISGLALGLSLAADLTTTVRAQEPDRRDTMGKTAGAEMGGELPEHGETPEIHPKSLALQLLNFGVLIVILVKFGGPAINKALSARHQQLKADLAAAETARAEAEARLARQEARLAKLEQEITDIQSGVKQEAEAEKARLIALAEERAKRIREETSFALDQQVKEAEGNLRREVALAAVQMAEQLVRKALNAGDQQRLVETFVTDVARPATPTATGAAVSAVPTPVTTPARSAV
jgi:F-type H+-transporting ATPase subunit b